LPAGESTTNRTKDDATWLGRTRRFNTFLLRPDRFLATALGTLWTSPSMASVAGLAGQSRARRSADGGCPWRLRAAAIMLRTPPLSPGWRSDLVHVRHRSGGRKSGSEGVAWRDGRGVRQAHLLVDKTDAGSGRAGQAAESSALLRRWFTLSCRSSTRVIRGLKYRGGLPFWRGELARRICAKIRVELLWTCS